MGLAAAADGTLVGLVLIDLDGFRLINERDAHTTLGDGVRVIGPTIIGDRVSIGAGATIENSIVWDGVRIGKGARVADSIVGIDFDIAAGATIQGSIVANEPTAAR